MATSTNPDSGYSIFHGAMGFDGKPYVAQMTRMVTLKQVMPEHMPAPKQVSPGMDDATVINTLSQYG